MATKEKKRLTGTVFFDDGTGNTLDIVFPEVEDFPWDVKTENDEVVFTICEGEEKKEKKFKIVEARQFLINNFNWNGIVHMMNRLPVYSDKYESYNVPMNLKGIASVDDELIIPDEAIEAIVYLQAKYAIETKYEEDPENHTKEILKYVDARAKSDFAKDVLQTSYEDLLKEVDNSEMCHDGNTFTMPNLKTVSESGLYDFLRNLVLAKNGLWSDESKITNFVSIRRDIETVNSKYNDTSFLVWKEGRKKKVLKYISSTEPGKLSLGQLEPQTTTMMLGFHDTSNATPSGRTRNAFRKKINSSELYFQSGDTSMNVHYASHGIYKHGFPKDVSEYGFEKNDKGKIYNESQSKAYFIIVKIFSILSRWGDGNTATDTCSYKNLENTVNGYKKSDVIIDSNGVKKIELKSSNNIIKTFKHSEYQNYISNNYNNKNKRNDIISLLLGTNTDQSESDYKAESLENLLNQLKKQDTFEKIISIQMEHEFNPKNIDARPGSKTIKKIKRNNNQKNKDKEEYDNTLKKAIFDWDELSCLLGDYWTNNSILSSKPDLRKKFIEEFRIRKENYQKSDLIDVDNFGALGINKRVNGWSEGCQVILGGQNFYDFMYNLIQFLPDSKQERWYYTLVDSSSIV